MLLIITSNRQVFRKYQFEKVDSKKDFESRLDKAIVGLENEIKDKRKAVQSLIDELKING